MRNQESRAYPFSVDRVGSPIDDQVWGVYEYANGERYLLATFRTEDEARSALKKLVRQESRYAQ